MLSHEAISKGFRLADVGTADLYDFIHVIKCCLKKYVDESTEFFGEWHEEKVADDFMDKMNYTLFQKLLLHDEIVGFLCFDIRDDKIGGISINIIEKAQNNGIGSLYLTHIISLSKEYARPIFLKTMKSNPAQYLYKRFGFKTYEIDGPLVSMIYRP